MAFEISKKLREKEKLAKAKLQKFNIAMNKILQRQANEADDKTKSTKNKKTRKRKGKSVKMVYTAFETNRSRH